jgi:hypothetical protein
VNAKVPDVSILDGLPPDDLTSKGLCRILEQVADSSSLAISAGSESSCRGSLHVESFEKRWFWHPRLPQSLGQQPSGGSGGQISILVDSVD